MSPRIIKNVPIIAILKEYGELLYWRIRKIQEGGRLNNEYYKYYYTSGFSLSMLDYEGKNILDIGCGPKGSLEWANQAAERIGLDPLADSYMKIGANKHLMKYVKGYAEDMPFEDKYFDFVCSFNNLDHVNDLQQTCKEINRVLKPGGLFLLMVEIHAKPTTTEPQPLPWSLLKDFFPDLEVLEEGHYENVVKNRMYSNSCWAKPLKNPEKQSGMLKAKLRKPLN